MRPEPSLHGIIVHGVEFFEVLLFAINIEGMKPPLPHSIVGSVVHGWGQTEPGKNLATPRVLRVVPERRQDAEGRLLFQLLNDQGDGIGRLSPQQDMKMFRHEHSTDQGVPLCGVNAQLAKHVDKMMG